MKLINVEFSDINTGDYPDFCDAFISYAEHENGTPLTDKELENIPSDVIHEYLWAHLY